MPYDLHGETERARETLWARREDAKALEALRAKLAAEAQMSSNVAAVQAQQGNA